MCTWEFRSITLIIYHSIGPRSMRMGSQDRAFITNFHSSCLCEFDHELVLSATRHLIVSCYITRRVKDIISLEIEAFG